MTLVLPYPATVLESPTDSKNLEAIVNAINGISVGSVTVDGTSIVSNSGTVALGPIGAFSILANTGTVSAKPVSKVLNPANFVESTPGTISTSGTLASINVTSSAGYKINGAVALTIDDALNTAAFGFHAGENNTGVLNTFIGHQAGQYNTTGGENTYVGQLAGQMNATGIMNTAVGEHAFGYDLTGSYNVHIGNDTARNWGNGSFNTAVGKSAMYCGAGGKNTAVGMGALMGNSWNVQLGGTVTNGDTVSLTFTGSYAGSPQTISVSTTGKTLTQIAADLVTAYVANTTVWRYGNTGCFQRNNTNLQFSFIPADAMVVTGAVTGAATETLAIAQGPTTDQANIAIGYNALAGYTLSTGANNIAMGESSLYSLTTGTYNVAIGVLAGNALTTGVRNILIGDSAGALLTTGGSSVIIGGQAGSWTTGASQTLVGYRAGWKLTTGTSNTALGSGALTNATTATQNTVVGASALGVGAHTGMQNVAIGYSAMQNNAAAASFHVAVGSNAMADYTDAQASSPNVAVGALTLNGASGASWASVAVGYRAGSALATGTSNTLLGFKSGAALTAASNNTLVGGSVGSVTLATGAGNILIGTDVNCDTASSSTSNTLMIRGSGASVTPVIQATGINTANPKVAIAAGTGSAAPTAGTDIPDKTFMAWKNTTDSSVKLYFNDGGTLKSVALT